MFHQTPIFKIIDKILHLAIIPKTGINYRHLRKKNCGLYYLAVINQIKWNQLNVELRALEKSSSRPVEDFSILKILLIQSFL